MAFLPTRNLRDHIGPTVDAALKEVVGAEEIWWDTAYLPTIQGSLVGCLVLTSQAVDLDKSYTTFVAPVDLRTLDDHAKALDAVRTGMDSIRSTRAAELAGNNGGGLEL